MSGEAHGSSNDKEFTGGKFYRGSDKWGTKWWYNDIVDDDPIPSAPLLEMEDVNQFNNDQQDEEETTLAKYHFTDLLKHNCVVVTSNGPASQHKGDFKSSKNK